MQLLARGLLVMMVAWAGCQGPPARTSGQDLAVPPPDAGPPPPDLTVPPDLQLPDLVPPGPDLYGTCPPGTRACGVLGSGDTRCIPDTSCCSNADCPAAGQTCDDSGTCSCPGGNKACGNACVPLNDCCIDADCLSRHCVVGQCLPAACDDSSLDGDETDVDCGGGLCPACVDGRTCGLDVDCRSNRCMVGLCAPGPFGSRSYGGGRHPAWVASADLDGDGKPDLVAGNLAGGAVSALRGRGDASFASLGSAGPRAAHRLATADLDGDGRADVVALSSDGYLATILRGQGDGTLAPGATLRLKGDPSSVAIADFTGDGKLDLVVTTRLGLLAGRGDGSFDPEVTIPGGETASSVAAGDIDGDGLADLVVADHGRATLSVLRGDGQGGFQALPALALPSAPTGLAIGDLNGDRRVEVVVGTSDSGAMVLINHGAGMLGLGGVAGGMVSIPELTLADVSGDQNLDLVGSGLVLLGNGNGSFGNPLAIPMDQAASVAVADYNADGKLDVAFPDAQQDAVLVLLGNGDGTFTPVGNGKGSHNELALLDPRAVALADLDGDGRAEVLVPSATGLLWVYSPDVKGVLGPAATYLGCPAPTSIAVADLDLDQNLDVLVGCAGGAPTLYRGSKQGVLTRVVPVNGQPPELNIAGATTLGVADLDRDGNADVFASDARSGRVLLGAGKGDFTFGNNLSPLLVDGMASLATLQLTDFDGDGFRDVVGVDGALTLVALNKGNDGMGRHQGFKSGASVPLPMRTAAVATLGLDLDGDTYSDLVVADGAATAILVLVNAGMGLGPLNFQAPVPYPLGARPAALAMIDANGDGRPDVATANLDGTLTLLLGAAKASFGDPARVDVGVGPLAIASGDVNGDRKVDLAVVNRDSGTVTILVNRF